MHFVVRKFNVDLQICLFLWSRLNWTNNPRSHRTYKLEPSYLGKEECYTIYDLFTNLILRVNKSHWELNKSVRYVCKVPIRLHTITPDCIFATAEVIAIHLNWSNHPTPQTNHNRGVIAALLVTARIPPPIPMTLVLLIHTTTCLSNQ